MQVGARREVQLAVVAETHILIACPLQLLIRDSSLHAIVSRAAIHAGGAQGSKCARTAAGGGGAAGRRWRAREVRVRRGNVMPSNRTERWDRGVDVVGSQTMIGSSNWEMEARYVSKSENSIVV